MTSRRRRERDALGGTLEHYYPRTSRDPYSSHLPAELQGPGHAGADVAARHPLRTRIRNRLGSWRRAWLPLPDEIIEEYLGHGERMIHNDHPSFRAFVIQHVILVVVLFVAAGLFVGVVLNGSLTAVLLTFLLMAIVLLVLVLQRLSERYTSYVITNVRIMRVSGVVTRRVHSIPWMRVTDLTFDQSWLGRMLGYATLHIESANEDSGLRDLAGVSDPMVFNKYLVDMVVAKQGPIAPGWEELGQAGPSGVVSRQRIGLRDRVREVRRRRREQRAADAGLGVPVARRRVPGTGRVPPRPAPQRTDQVFYGDSGQAGDDDLTRQPRVDEAEPGQPGSGGAADRDPERSGTQGADPLREGPESSVPWGRDRE
ncbi:MAG TPA: PH domain-containing protein [Acidimicrobiales bacterium]|nr:PH domain-containing protein [Acidimicrobiales bacterium]